MVGSSASATAMVPSIFGSRSGGLSTPALAVAVRIGWRDLESTWLWRGGGRTGSTAAGSGGSGVGDGRWSGGAPPPEPGGLTCAAARTARMNEKSSASDDEIHGTCSLREARVTPTRVRFSVSSAIRSGTRISLSSSRTNRL